MSDRLIRFLDDEIECEKEWINSLFELRHHPYRSRGLTHTIEAIKDSIAWIRELEAIKKATS